MIKALEKQLADERSVRGEYEKTNAEMKKQMIERESKYKDEVLLFYSFPIISPIARTPFSYSCEFLPICFSLLRDYSLGV